MIMQNMSMTNALVEGSHHTIDLVGNLTTAGMKLGNVNTTKNDVKDLQRWISGAVAAKVKSARVDKKAQAQCDGRIAGKDGIVLDLAGAIAGDIAINMAEAIALNKQVVLVAKPKSTDQLKGQMHAKGLSSAWPKNVLQIDTMVDVATHDGIMQNNVKSTFGDLVSKIVDNWFVDLDSVTLVGGRGTDGRNSSDKHLNRMTATIHCTIADKVSTIDLVNNIAYMHGMPIDGAWPIMTIDQDKADTKVHDPMSWKADVGNANTSSDGVWPQTQCNGKRTKSDLNIGKRLDVVDQDLVSAPAIGDLNYDGMADNRDDVRQRGSTVPKGSGHGMHMAIEIRELVGHVSHVKLIPIAITDDVGVNTQHRGMGIALNSISRSDNNIAQAKNAVNSI